MMSTVTELIEHRRPVSAGAWHRFFDDLADGRLARCEVVATLTAFCSVPAGPGLVAGLHTSLRERHRPQTERIEGVVNIVGTGGGPATFNISTAAALTAAAMGIRVVKSGSRAFTSRHGSIDLLDRLGVRTSAAGTETLASLDQHGIAFAGTDVYPSEFLRLARAVSPGSVRPYSPFFNLVGPFTADVPAARQLTGVSDLRSVDAVLTLAALSGRRTWVVTNEAGADEVLPFADNTVHVAGGCRSGRAGETLAVGPVDLTPAVSRGTLDALRPVDDPVTDFCDVLAGTADRSRVAVVAVNAAALSLVAGRCATWYEASIAAFETLRSGAPLDLLRRLTNPAELHPPHLSNQRTPADV